MSDFLWSLASGGWIALGALAAFAPPQSRRRRGAAFLVGLAWLLAVLACAVDAGPFRGFVASIDDFGDAVALTLRSAWLLAPAFLAYRSLRGDR